MPDARVSGLSQRAQSGFSVCHVLEGDAGRIWRYAINRSLRCALLQQVALRLLTILKFTRRWACDHSKIKVAVPHDLGDIHVADTDFLCQKG